MSSYVPKDHDHMTIDNVARGFGMPSEEWVRTLARKACELLSERHEVLYARSSLPEKLKRAHEKTAEFGHIKRSLTCRIDKLERRCAEHNKTVERIISEKQEQIDELQRQVAALSGSTKKHIEVRLDTGIVYVRHGTSHDDGVVAWGLWEAQQ